MIYFFYMPGQSFLVKRPVSLFEGSFARYDDEVCFLPYVGARSAEVLSSGDLVVFYNLSFSSRPVFCDEAVRRGALLFNRPLFADKVAKAEVMRDAGVPSPRFVSLPEGRVDRSLFEDFRFPLIIKPASKSSGGKNIIYVPSLDRLPRRVARHMILQEYVPEGRRGIVRINLVGDFPCVSMKVDPVNDSPVVNLSSAGSLVRYVPSADEVDVSVRASRLMGLDLSGVDLVQGADGPVVIEVNAVPGFMGAEELGVPFQDYIVDLIVKRARAHWVDTVSSL